MKQIFLILFLTLSLTALCAGSPDKTLYEADRLFNEGNNLAANDHAAASERWKQAAGLLEQVIKEHSLCNGPLFYNLGNIYYRLGDTGNAILNYRKAEYFMPGDNNLIRNLSIARRSRKDAVEIKESTRVMKTLFFWHYDFSVKTRENIFLAAITVLIAGLLIRLRFKHTCIIWIISISALLSAVSAASVCITEIENYKHPQGVIIAREVTGRTGYSESYAESFEEPLHAGTEFRLQDRRADWIEIQLTDGSRTWIPEKDAGLVQWH